LSRVISGSRAQSSPTKVHSVVPWSVSAPHQAIPAQQE
jgi:hypothetical protein